MFGQKGATLYSQKGALAIEADRDTHTRTDHNRDSKLFGLIASEGNSTERKEQVLSSDVGSATNLRLASAEELRIQGAKVEAGQHLGIEAKGDLVVDSVQPSMKAKPVPSNAASVAMPAKPRQRKATSRVRGSTPPACAMR